MAGLNLDLSAAGVSLSAGVAKTVLGVKSAANHPIKLLEYHLTFMGGVSTEVPALIEVCRATFATNPPGTNSTTVTARKRDNRVAGTVQLTAAHTWTGGNEPTVLTVMHTYEVAVYNGQLHYIVPFHNPIFSDPGEGFAFRVTAPAAATVTPYASVEE